MSAPVQPAAGPAVRLPVAVLAVLATVVVALLAVGLVVRLDADRLPSGPPRDPPPAPAEATEFSVDSARTARLQEFSVTLPGAPFGCGDASTPPTGFTAYVGCSSVVHANYNAAGNDWSALGGVLLVGDDLVTAGDLGATTKAVFDALVPQLYSAGDRYSLSKVSDGDVQLPVPADRLSSRLANVDVRKKGLATPYDRLVVVVVRLESGRHVAFFSDFPHDGSKAALNAVTTSLNTISLRG
ncbi:hypothetical protein GCM10022197_25020 [Microlunatus spumicola]|uniref:PknH-like extracellular domain-containing protein n=1 Tax=Microlunatus spumicola TaxID=81499 RepID=A0ABP6XIR5_9ACTN